MEPLVLRPNAELGRLRRSQSASPLQDALGYTAQQPGDGLEYRFAPGTLAAYNYLSADFLLDGNLLAVFVLHLQEAGDGSVCAFSFGLLNQCQARLRMPLEAVNQNTWMYPREGALLKPLVWGQRVDLSKVDRLRLELYRTSGEPVNWWMTDLHALVDKPPLLEQPLLPAGPLLDALGQSRLHNWPEKTASVEALVTRLRQQQSEAASACWPEGFSRWGGWLGRAWEASGFFRTAFAEDRWWLVDPDGHPFWSTGPDCVGTNIDSAYSGIESALEWLPPDDGAYAPAHAAGHWGQRAFDYLIANFIRVFGPDWHDRWADNALSHLRRWGFNTVANWSDWRAASQAGFPYVRPLNEKFSRCAAIYRSFPDVYDPAFEADAQEFAQQLEETANDPAMIGYFLMNEPTWGFSTELVAEGMMHNTPQCASRRAFAAFLGEQYGQEASGDAALSAAWEMPVSLAQVAQGEWSLPFTPAARIDLEAFSTRMVERFFGLLNVACRKVDPHHLNLGARYYTVPPAWVAQGMRGFDVFSINCYREEVPVEDLRAIHDLLGLPTLVGEWHFGAHDAGLPASGIGRVADQAARGQAYRVYVEGAAGIPWCVGVHYFTLYDQSALGRFDGENYNIGFLDVCSRPYQPLAEAARLTHQRLYAVVSGQEEPFRERPEYLPKLFL
jgi:hypothetical protein